MFDPVQAQEDLLGALLSADVLKNVTIKSYRRMRIAKELDYRVLLTTVRNGRCGAGILVAQPEASGRNPNVTGPVLDWTFPIVAMEHPTINFNPDTGTMLSAEELAQIAMDVLQQHSDDKLGTFRIESNAIQPEKEFVFEGCVSYRTNFTVVGKCLQRPRMQPVVITSENGLVTMSCLTDGFSIWYTLDGSFPSTDDAGNSASQLYMGPFQANPGDVIRAAAHKAGMNISSVRYFEVPT